jgi:hypothetical protein
MDAGSGTGGGPGGAAAGDANVALTEKEPGDVLVIPVSVNEMVSLALSELKPDKVPAGTKFPTR